MIESGLKIWLKSLGIYIMGFGIFALLIMVPFAMFWGVAAVSAFLYPLFSILASVSIIVFIVLILPLSLIESLRTRLAIASVMLSYICGAAVWMYSFLTLIGFFGWLAIFFVFLFRFLAPLVTTGLFIKGQWASGLTVLTGLLFTYGMRFYGFWLEGLYNKEIQQESEIIDTEARTIE